MLKKSIVLLSFCSALGLCAAEPAVTIPFDANGDAVAQDRVFKGALGRKSGNRTIPSLLVDGIVNKAFASGQDADGNLHTIYYHPATIKGETNSVSLWVKPVDWQGGDKAQHGFFSAQGKDSQRLLIYRIGYDSRMQVYLGSLSNPKLATVAFLPAKNWKAGEWHQITAVWDAKMLKLFIDGKLAAQKPVVTPISGDFTTFAVGENFGANSGCTVIDEVRIFNAALSDAEAAAEFTRIRK